MPLLIILIYFIIIFSSIVLHEYAHGWTAFQLGDPTAKQAGRLTLNPIKHIDLFGTLLLPIGLLILRTLGVPVIFFGWAKPVPVNFARLRHPRRDMMIVGLAGPLTNIMIALLASCLLRLNLNAQQAELVSLAVFINLLLAVFNLIPIPPLDGSRFVMGLLPRGIAMQYARLERFGIVIVILLLSAGLLRLFIIPFIEILANWLGVQLI